MSTNAWNLLQGELVRRNVPLHVLYEVTERCNYACTHCYLPHRGDDELSTAEALAMIDGLADAGTMFLTLTGGEIFLRRDIFEIAEHARAREMVLRIFTNGWFVDDERADRLAALDPLAVEISLYGPDAVTFETVTQLEGSFARTCAAIRRLTARGVRVKAKTPVMSVNARRLAETEALAISLGADFQWDPLISPMDGGEKTPLSLRASDEDLAAVFAWEHARSPQGIQGDAKDLDSAPCSAGRGAAAVSPRGDVYACVAIKVAAGNVREKPFGEIWFSNEGILGSLRGITVAGLKSCANCEDRPYCPRCAGMAFHEEGSLLAPNLEACRVAAHRHAVADGRAVPERAPSPFGHASLRILRD